nr:immunoglobulin light chain junction region [Macaca mulatta]
DYYCATGHSSGNYIF